MRSYRPASTLGSSRRDLSRPSWSAWQACRYRQYQRPLALIQLANEAEPWLTLIARRTERTIAEVVQIYADDPEALTTDIAAILLQTAERLAADLGEAKPKDRTIQLRKLTRSPHAEERLAAALYRARVETKKP